MYRGTGRLLHATVHRDQYGNSLERILLGASIDEARIRLLLLMPVYERRPDGVLELVRYVAIHHPVAPRRTHLEPWVSLVETYRHTLFHETGYYLGPLAHKERLAQAAKNVQLEDGKITYEPRIISERKYFVNSGACFVDSGISTSGRGSPPLLSLLAAWRSHWPRLQPNAPAGTQPLTISKRDKSPTLEQPNIEAVSPLPCWIVRVTCYDRHHGW